MEGGLDIYQILLESGIIVKSVLFILIGCSVLSWAIILQKRKTFLELKSSNEKFIEIFHGSSNLLEISEEVKNYQASSVGLMFSSGYGELTKIREKLQENGQEAMLKHYLDKHGMEALSRSLQQGANLAAEKMDHRLSTLASIGSITPFIGLFGTVWGIIDSFAGLASGGGSIEAVAPGIAEALVATAVGLAAAIPAVWAYNVFNSKVSVLSSQMENFGQDFLNLIERSVLISKD
jgi:biopolymer transport protein TolQ